MVTKNFVINNRYFDSIMLMSLSNRLREKVSGIEEAAAIMGSDENKKILREAGLLDEEGERALPGDLIIAIKGKSQEAVESGWKVAMDLLRGEAEKIDEKKAGASPRTIKSALKVLPDANLVLISLPGEYAASEAMEAISRGMNVMVFSDNVPVEEEIAIKRAGEKRGLFVLGPDCGTSIINGVALGFANVVRRGVFGIVGAAGTGIQELVSLIHRKGYGITHAIGTGGRDLSEEVGGIAFINALRVLGDDSRTEVIILLSKPPSPDVARRVIDEVISIGKPAVIVFLGNETSVEKDISGYSIQFAQNLEEAVERGISLYEKKEYRPCEFTMLENEVNQLVEREANRIGRGRFLRGLFSGGTLADEAIFILRKKLGKVYSNTVKEDEFYLENPEISREHTIIDMGEDYFTKAKPHPMIDFTLRKERIVKEASSGECGVILFDVVLGFGVHVDPASELASAVEKAREIANKDGWYISFVCSITGTDEDPQNYSVQKKKLLDAGVIVMDSNAQAAALCGYILGVEN